MRDLRAIKGMTMASWPGTVTPTQSGSYEVRSENHRGLYVVARNSEEEWECSCEDYQYRRMPCKHCWAVIYALRLASENLGNT
ncbi:MAG: SWIM zinc finger family protein [archaeon]|nr:MAG: SWIM zinc finger family protein [archaeon]